MIERPFNQLRDLFRENNKLNKELLRYVFEKSDNISLWIIGLAIGGITIFANNIGKVKGAINSDSLLPILYLLAASVTTGILYRISYLYFFVVLEQTANGIDIAFSRQETMDTESFLKGNETYEELLKVVESGTGADFAHLIQLHINSDETNKKLLYDSMVKHYLESVAFAKKDRELAFDFIADTYSKFIGISKEKYIKRMESQNIGRQFKWTLRITSFLYFSFILTFIIALFLFVKGSGN